MNEFQFLYGIRSRYSLDRIGDDCAVLPQSDVSDLLMTADLLVQDVDFRLEWTTPEFLGHKALAVSLSDIAAMGGSAKWSMLSIGIPEFLWKTDFLDLFYEGWFELAGKFAVKLVGGDISRVPHHLVIDSIVGGEAPKGKAILRSTARAGDSIFVSGSLGGAAGALKMLENGIRYDPETPRDTDKLILKQLQPQPELYLANRLQQLDIVTAAIDISDGLSSDLGHICYESGVGAVIYAEKLPIDPLLSAHFPDDECQQMALHGGEDFGLLFTVDPKSASFADLPGVTRIGEITANAGAVELISSDDQSHKLEPVGYRHF
jgi:thiamine-monophosphate kinase